MGLDMYLKGRKLEREPYYVDGFPCFHHELELGYWRKHPDLHGYIVREFAEGVDDCREIPLKKADIEKIIGAIERNELPFTTGFFFGESGPEDKEKSLDIFHKALKWLLEEERFVYKSIFYRASW